MKSFSQIPKSLQTINFDSGSRQVLCTHVWAHLRIKRRRHFQTGKILVCNPHTKNYLKYCMRAPCRQMYIKKVIYSVMTLIREYEDIQASRCPYLPCCQHIVSERGRKPL